MNKQSSDYSEAAVYIFMFLGLLVIAIGIYLTLTNHLAVGISTGGKGSPKAGTVGKIRGEFILAGGILFSAFPAYAIIKRLIKKSLKKRK